MDEPDPPRSSRSIHPVGSRMRIASEIALSALLVLALAPGGSLRAAEPASVPPDHARRMQAGLALFKESVRPALIRSCLDCHGGQKTKGGFDPSDRGPMIDSGAIDGGKDSLFYALITHAEEPHMPYQGAQLPDETIEQIARWIDLGAPYDRPLVERTGVEPAQASTM